MNATKKDKEDEIVQVGILITLLGPEGLRIYETFSWTAAGDENKIKKVLEKFDLHFQPRKSETFERYKFLTRHQRPGESCETFLLEIQSLIATCDYSIQRDSILRDQIVIGVADNKTREKLLFDPQLTLAKAIDILRACEASSLLADQMNSEAVHRLRDKSKSNSSQQQPQETQQRRDGGQQHREQFEIKNCHFCGDSHKKGRCPAFGKDCAKCGKKNHAAKVCRSTTAGGKVDSIEEIVNIEDLIVSELKSGTDSQWLIQLHVHGHQVRFKIDTGASCNVLPWSVYHRICDKPLLPGPTLRNNSGQLLRVLGKQHLSVHLKGKQYTLPFVVIEESEVPILGLPSCQELRVVERLDEAVQETQIRDAPILQLPPGMESYGDVFRGLGKLPHQHEIRLKQDYTPVVRPARRIPFKIRDQVKRKLDEMEHLKVICKVVEPTEWVSPMVVAHKPGGDVRLCLDPLDLNKSVQRQHYPVPTAQELFSRIGKAKYFSTLDATSGFL